MEKKKRKYIKREYDINSTVIGLIVRGFKGHNKKKCPCKNCMGWRKSTYQHSIFRQMQLEIRKDIYLQLQESKELDNYIL